ncbi:hypothetical protein IQ251_06160 [Saccharopolyspora sp. HNM0983]|uniref:Uncharacterized protein n=1 Tax=Saccharopolyspora montiporae TaxID=2781240 RepID=A0A929BAA9_9PSEU|nr:hypothetical protein [Saccharopolyspora sp. HNM0983]MBE9374028.1 hypothetical protein [Saccharopolyspora sp. HNM0983]
MARSNSGSVVLGLSLALFGIGLLAIAAVFGLFAAGYENLPVWLNLLTLLCPAGLLFGVLATGLRSRRGRS